MCLHLAIDKKSILLFTLWTVMASISPKSFYSKKTGKYEIFLYYTSEILVNLLRYSVVSCRGAINSKHVLQTFVVGEEIVF